MNENAGVKTQGSKEKEAEQDRGIAGGICYWINSQEQVQSVQLEQAKAIKLDIESKKPYSGIDFSDYGFPIEARLERVDVQLVNRDKRPNPKYETLFVGQLHADEQEAPKIFDDETSKDLMFPHLKVMEAHAAANIFNRREVPLPLPEDELDLLDLDSVANIVILTKGTGTSGVGLDEVIGAYHNDIAKEKLRRIFEINPECAQALTLQSEIKIIKNLLNNGKTEEAKRRSTLLKPKLAALASGREWVLAKNINLNRQFFIEENARNWEDIEKTIQYPEAKMFLQLIKDSPELRYLFSIHEDPEHGTDDEIIRKKNAGKTELLFGNAGVYFYDSHFDENNDLDQELIQKLHKNLVDRLVKCGFRILNGLDSEGDSNLGFSAERGYINQPNITKDGKRAKSSKALEDAFVEIGRLGLTGKDDQKIQAQRAFCLEIPGRLSTRRKAELLKIYQEELIVPFLAAHGIS